jgi:hypothetical protein
MSHDNGDDGNEELERGVRDIYCWMMGEIIGDRTFHQ